MNPKKASPNSREILVVEDSPTQREQIRHLLENRGYSVRLAPDGKQALEIMHKHQPTIVISDILMPEMDGYALCREIKSDDRFRDIPVILLTSLTGPEDIIKGLQCGADNFIRKPFDEKYLLSRIEYMFANLRLRKSDKLQMGVELYLAGQKHFITSERQQILDLLISTYDQAVQINEDLKTREKELDRANKILQGLYQIAKGLNQAVTEQGLVEQALDRVVRLPGIRAGWITLVESDSAFQVVAIRGLPSTPEVLGALDGACLCRRRLLSGELERTMIVAECERCAGISAKVLGFRSHLTIPLRVDEHAVGIVNLVTVDQMPFSDDDLQTLNGIGNQIGIALERVRMREHLEQLVQARTAALTAEITERKQAEEALAAERNLLRTLIDAIPDEIAVKDTQRRFILVNPATVRALNRGSAEEIIGKKDEDLIPERFALQAREEEEGVLETGRPFVNKLGRSKINPVTGEIERSILISKIPMKDREGKIIGVVGINRDITEVQRAAESLEKERTLLLTLIESIPDEICLKDTSHRYVVANSATLKALGARSLDDLVYKTDLDFVPAEMAQEHFAEEKAILESGKPMINRERIKRDPKTSEIEKCLLTSKVPVKDQTGKTIGILVVNRYITDRKRAEETLRRSEEQYRSLVESARHAIFTVSRNGTLTSLNAAFETITGWKREEWLGRTFSELFHSDDRLKARQLFEQVIQGAIVPVQELRFLKKSGASLIGELTVTRQMHNSEVIGALGIGRDITESKMLAEQVRQAQKMESLGLLAGGIAHDFNNILGIILGHTSVVERAHKDPSVLKSSTDAITTAVQRGAGLVRQILTFARKADVALEPVNVNVTIRELSKMLGDTFPKTIDVSLELSSSIPIIMMDQTQLHQALLNLCVNARDAMTDPLVTKLGRGRLTLRTGVIDGSELRKRFNDASAAQYVCIVVCDTGKGMDEATKQKIFEPFFTTKEWGRGTGLGLAVVYGIVRGHHGQIEVESEMGRSTSFRLYLPVQDAVATPAPDAKYESVAIQGGTETILLVEDEAGLMGLMKSALERNGYTVLTATDGIEAIREFTKGQEKISLVLTDLGLPRLDGVAVFSTLRDMKSDIRIILASGYLDPKLKSELLRSGAKEFIQKPYNPNEVLRKIREVLDSEK